MFSMKVTMSALVKIILILTLHQISFESNILDEENVKLSLKYLCPDVDICNRNALTTHVNPNEVDERGFRSCCHACSCYKDCNINGNCCFPADREAKSNSNTSFANINSPIEQGNSSLISDQNSLDSASIETNSTTHDSTNGTAVIRRGIKTINQGHRAVDRNNISIDIELAAKKCMYIKTGTSDEYWTGRIPAVRMVTSPPPGGCTANTICPTLTKQSVQASCNSEDIFPWGDLFPVYSVDYKLIFKNELCACCYGVMKYIPWLPMLECDIFDNNRNIPLSEHFSFLQQANTLPNYCSVAFQSVDTPLSENQCFVDSIGTCQEFLDNYFPHVPDGTNLTRSEIVKACNDGPDAPVQLVQGVYKNVFCAMCNVNVNVDMLQCFAGGDSITSNSFAGKGFAYLLDTTSIKKLTQNGKRDEVFPDPIACLKNQGVWIEDSCRIISCPTGQVRMDGICTFIIKRWMSRGGVELIVNLKYITNNTSVLRMLRNEEDMTDKVGNAFRRTSPWPSYWIITRILHTSGNDSLSPQLAVFMESEITLPKKLMNSIKKSLRRQWNIMLNGIGITFEQSFMKYKLDQGIVSNAYAPQWIMYVAELESSINMSVNESLTFENILTDSISSLFPFSLNKLVICEQITLSQNEYTIMAGGMILLNKLSNKIMFSLEFERIEDVNGELVPRICLSDSPFILRRDNNGAATVVINLKLVWAMLILKLILVLDLAPIG